ncbi:MAG TPA: arylamine N-acetyltransferase [Acidimicrobiia bacterium]|nr:arylamine N-acetyltransferase [Acidimicrobiia bacterium]
MNVEAYLDRIGLSEPLEPDLAYLERLQRAHLTAIPFENLDVYARREMRTEDTWSISKLVDRGRGGWCFELNGAFANLLEELGYDVKRLAAHVVQGSGAPMPTHLSLEVALDRPYLVDVGFGDSFIKPLPLDSGGPHDGGTGDYGFVFDGERVTLVSYEADGTVEPHYRFERTDRQLADFEEASVYLRTTPGLQWTQARFATRLLDGGPDRVTLLSDRIKFRRSGTWTEHPVDDSEWERLLSEWFSLEP